MFNPYDPESVMKAIRASTVSDEYAVDVLKDAIKLQRMEAAFQRALAEASTDMEHIHSATPIARARHYVAS